MDPAQPTIAVRRLTCPAWETMEETGNALGASGADEVNGDRVDVLRLDSPPRLLLDVVAQIRRSVPERLVLGKLHWESRKKPLGMWGRLIWVLAPQGNVGCSRDTE